MPPCLSVMKTGFMGGVFPRIRRDGFRQSEPNPLEKNLPVLLLQGAPSRAFIKKKTSDYMERKPERIRLRILVPVVLALFLVLLSSLLGTNWLKERKIAGELGHAMMQVQQLLPKLLQTDAQIMSVLIEDLEDDQALQNFFNARDRGGLFSRAVKLFDSLKSKYNITHFYFINLDRSCFLRVHKQESFGDVIDRFTLQQAEQQKKLSSGIELGPFGTFTLRVVSPWYIGGELKGYLELGIGIEHLKPQLAEILGVELILCIDKQYLDRSQWEEGQRLTGSVGNWGQFSTVVIVDKTIRDVPPAFAAEIEKAHTEHKGKLIRTVAGRRYLGGGLISLKDAGGRTVGDIIVLKDVTLIEKSWRTLMAIQLVIWMVIIFILCAFFYSYTLRIENNLSSAREELFQKQKLTVLGQLAGGVGHELRNPLGVIKNAVYFIKMRNNAIADSAVIANLDIIERELGIASKIVSDMLNFARVKTPVFSSGLDLNKLVAETLSKVKIPNNITVTTEFSKNLTRVAADATQVQQIFINLIENALEAMDGGGNLKIATRSTDEVHEAVFADEGCGISKDNLRKIFEPLYTGKAKGIGLGLAVSKSLAEANDAVIEVQSEEGTGSTFTVRFTGR